MDQNVLQSRYLTGYDGVGVQVDLLLRWGDSRKKKNIAAYSWLSFVSALILTLPHDASEISTPLVFSLYNPPVITPHG